MAILKNPKTVLIKNQYYPSGLTEEQVWKYYQKNKYKILEETNHRNLMLGLAIKENEIILKRKGKNSRYIYLTTKNYDEIMHGRVLVIYSTMNKNEDIAIIDIDINDFNMAKQSAFFMYNYVNKKISMVRSAKIRFTGKESFHIICQLNRKYNIDDIRATFKHQFINDQEIMKNFTVDYKRSNKIPNLDLSPNKTSGAFITNHSLSKVGLRCMDIPVNKLKLFRKKEGVIK